LIILFGLNGLYNLGWDVSRFDIIIRLSKVILFAGFIIFLITFEPERLFTLSRLTPIVFVGLLICTVSLFRLILIQIEKQFSVLEYAPHPTILVGTSRSAQKMVKDINKNPHLLYDIKGFVTQSPEKSEFMGLKNLGTFSNLAEIIRRYSIEEIIIAIQERSRDEILKIIAAAENLRVSFKIIPQMYDVISGHKTREVIGHPLIRLFPDQMLPWQWIIKRMLDISIATIALFFLIPVFLLAFLMQTLTGTFPFLVIENRVGKQGNIYGQLLLNLPDRDTYLGKIMYRSYIWKLPQLVNVIFGSMAIVGPRPETEELVTDLRRKIKFYNRRFLVRPGITGWTQVRYRYSESLKHLKEQFKHDLYYLENMSIFFDLRIIVRSLFILLFRR
jgi:lipopolysaccharide/colanic/teichoic acid biosynthesis glycosyltransferase